MSTLCQKSWVFSGLSGFLPQGKLTGRVENGVIVRKAMTIKFVNIVKELRFFM